MTRRKVFPTRLSTKFLKNDMSVYGYQVQLIKFIFSMANHMQNPEPVLSSLFKKDANILDTIMRQNSVDFIKKWIMSDILRPIIRIQDEMNQNLYHKVCNEVFQMISQEYDTDLTLESCASRLHYHPSYLRKILKKVHNTSYSEYLAKYRLEIAKKVAWQYGFDNSGDIGEAHVQ